MFYLLKPLLCKGFPDSFETISPAVRVSGETRRIRQSYPHSYPQIATEAATEVGIRPNSSHGVSIAISR